MTANSTFEQFSTETMSGVTPGTHTAVFQRLRLSPVAQSAEGPSWARLSWQGVGEGNAVAYDAGRSYALHLLTESGDSWAAEPLLLLENGSVADLPGLLVTAATVKGWRVMTCAACRWWQMVEGTTADGLPVGACRWQAGEGDSPAGTALVERQSALALDCPHWIEDEPNLASPEAVDVRPNRAVSSPSGLDTTDAGRLGRQGLVARLKRWAGGERGVANGLPRWTARLTGHAGAAVGTEPCLACQGRVVNLGSLGTTSPEGDRMTYSVWRCGVCCTTYLNCWINRWARLDTLETDERLFRVAPAQAVAMLTWIEEADSPDRASCRDRFDGYVAEHEAISRLVKHGR